MTKHKFSSKSFAVACLIVFSVPSYADDYADTGNYWNALCNSQTKDRPSLCVNYAMGLVNGILAQASFSGTQKPYCPPTGVTFGQYSDIFYRYLANNPENRHLDSAVLAIESWQQAFPCKKK